MLLKENSDDIIINLNKINHVELISETQTQRAAYIALEDKIASALYDGNFRNPLEYITEFLSPADIGHLALTSKYFYKFIFDVKARKNDTIQSLFLKNAFASDQLLKLQGIFDEVTRIAKEQFEQYKQAEPRKTISSSNKFYLSMLSLSVISFLVLGYIFLEQSKHIDKLRHKTMPFDFDNWLQSCDAQKMLRSPKEFSHLSTSLKNCNVVGIMIDSLWTCLYLTQRYNCSQPACNKYVYDCEVSYPHAKDLKFTELLLFIIIPSMLLAMLLVMRLIRLGEIFFGVKDYPQFLDNNFKLAFRKEHQITVEVAENVPEVNLLASTNTVQNTLQTKIDRIQRYLADSPQDIIKELAARQALLFDRDAISTQLEPTNIIIDDRTPLLRPH